MRFRTGAALLLAAATGSVAPAAQTKAPSPAQQKMPVSYVCTMPGDEGVVEDKPGICPNPKCKMVLQPVRIEQAWACANNTSIIRVNAGKCPVDGRDLVPVTVAHFFACNDERQYFPDGGKCADGSARVERREIRAHGDHNPVHGGQFFMAEDNWHHVEGTYPNPGLFRAFFYDNFKKPLPGKNFSGSLMVLDKTDKELATLPLAASRDGNTLEARIPPQLATFPLRAKATIKYDPKAREQPFDFVFNELSKDPGPARPAPATTTGAAAPARPAASTAKPAPAGTAANTPARPPAASTAAPPADSQEPLILDSPTNVPPALADALDESKLPNGTPELLAELAKRAGDVEALVNEGNLSQVWLPATATKTVALVLEGHANSLPERQRIAVSDSVKRVVTSAWELDAYGDLGDRKKITEAYQRLATAVGDLKAAYAK
jgi:hypothetical protein